MRRVTADSNIIISALSRGGKPQELLDLARPGEIELAVSDAILDEVGRILSDKFEWSAERVNTVRVELATFTTHAAPWCFSASCAAGGLCHDRRRRLLRSTGW